MTPMLTESATASRLSEIQEIVRLSSRLLPRGAGSKTAMQAAQADAPLLEAAALSGMLEYQPQEFTFTALAGTPLADIERRLRENGQYLPFDPPLVARGAPLGAPPPRPDGPAVGGHRAPAEGERAAPAIRSAAGSEGRRPGRDGRRRA